jgi:hypothetical protein
MRFTKSITTVLALTVAAATFSADAQAGHRHHHGGSNAVAAGILGFGAGAILGGALSQPRYGYYPGTVYVEPAPVYVEPAPVYVRPAPVYVYEPWSPAWYDYCEDRYRSFNPSTGYFVGHDGDYHLCR